MTNAPNEISLLKRLGAVVRSALTAIRTALLFSLDSCCLILPTRINETVVVLRLDAIGDFFLWMQSGAVEISEFAASGGRHSVLVANSAWADYARSTGLWDEVISVSPVRLMRHPLYRLAILRKIRRLGAAVLIQPRHARVFLQEDAIARISGCQNRIGSAGTFINSTQILRALGNRYYDHLVTVAEGREIHELERNSAFVMSVVERTATRFVFEHGQVGRGRPTISVAVGAGQVGRVWPVKNFVQLIEHIRIAFPKYEIVLIGSVGDQKRAEAIEAIVGPGLINIVGSTSLSEMVEMIARSQLVISNDSSAFHIAMAVGSNALCFLGGGHFGWYAPYPASYTVSSKVTVLYEPMECFWCNWHCKYPRAVGGSLRCVAAISVHSAVEAADAILSAITRDS